MANERHATWRRWGPVLVLIALPVGQALASSASAAPPARRVRGRVDPLTRFLLGRALSGASLRLRQPACQAVLSDFSDASGRTLDRVLEELGYTAEGYLGLVFFADGAGHESCRTDVVGAFTIPGRRVVHVCPLALRRLSRQDPALLEALLIHELLHTLGLQENPPTTEQISARVEKRCLSTRW